MPLATRQRLLDAAVELLIAEGRNEITTGRLAEKAGVVQSAFYNHFSSVEECKQAALDEVRRNVIATAEVILAELGDPGETTARDVDQMLARIFARVPTGRAEFRLLTQRHPEADVTAAVDVVLDQVRGSIAETLQRSTQPPNSFGDAEAAIAARLVVSVFLTGLEHVLDGADPGLTSEVCAMFMTSGVVAMNDRATRTSPTPEPNSGSSEITPTEG